MRRCANLEVASALARTDGPVSLGIDSTGLKVFGTGEWPLEKHGGQARRSWRKFHLAVDPDTGEILASELTTTQDGDASLVGPLLDRIKRRIGTVLADGAYDGEPVYRAVAAHTPDAEVIIPPRSTAVPGETAASAPTQRDQHLPMIAERGRLGWQRAVGYGRRSLGEVAMLRSKTLIGRSLRARTLPAQKVEAAVGCKVMNMMTSLGMPASRKVAGTTTFQGRARQRAKFCTNVFQRWYSGEDCIHNPRIDGDGTADRCKFSVEVDRPSPAADRKGRRHGSLLMKRRNANATGDTASRTSPRASSSPHRSIFKTFYFKCLTRR